MYGGSQGNVEDEISGHQPYQRQHRSIKPMGSFKETQELATVDLPMCSAPGTVTKEAELVQRKTRSPKGLRSVVHPRICRQHPVNSEGITAPVAAELYRQQALLCYLFLDPGQGGGHSNILYKGVLLFQVYVFFLFLFGKAMVFSCIYLRRSACFNKPSFCTIRLYILCHLWRVRKCCGPCHYSHEKF